MRIGRYIIFFSLGLAVFAFFLPANNTVFNIDNPASPINYIELPIQKLKAGAFTDSDFARCDACHVQVGDEFSRTVIHKSMKCTSCHNVSDFAPDLYTHNATTVECTYCHDETNASQFSNDAHYNFQSASINSSIFVGRNEMCVACHTAIDLEIEWHSYKSMDMTVLSRKGFWEMQFSVSGDDKNISYTNYTDYLNSTNWTNRSKNS